MIKTILRRGWQMLWREWILPFGLFFMVMAPLKSAVVDWNWVPSGSMKPTILEGDLVWVNKLAYDLKVPFTTQHLAKWSDPRRGDVAVFFSPKDGTRLVKRVIGVPGDTVELRNDVLYLNGTPQRYTALAPELFKPEIREDKNPWLAVEHLAGADHAILVLPGRPAVRSFGPVVVGPDQYFMMGDSRDNSFDSRFFGLVPRAAVVGRATTVLASFDLARYLRPRMSRFFQSLTLVDGRS